MCIWFINLGHSILKRNRQVAYGLWCEAHFKVYGSLSSFYYFSFLLSFFPYFCVVVVLEIVDVIHFLFQNKLKKPLCVLGFLAFNSTSLNVIQLFYIC